MGRFNIHSLSLRTRLAATCFVLVVGCVSAEAQETIKSTSRFEVSGRVVSKTKYDFEVQTKQGGIVSVAVNDATDFALRMSNPWFDRESGTVAVDGMLTATGRRERLKYSLPEGTLYLLSQFRSVSHRNRIMKQESWRINNYLISDQPIESALPAGDELLLSGELDLETLELIVDGNRHPITLGFRSATLRGRSIADIIPQETVVSATVIEIDGTKVADTVLFLNR